MRPLRASTATVDLDADSAQHGADSRVDDGYAAPTLLECHLCLILSNLVPQPNLRLARVEIREYCIVLAVLLVVGFVRFQSRSAVLFFREIPLQPRHDATMGSGAYQCFP